MAPSRAGENTNGQCNPPDVTFVQIAAGRWHSLGLRGNGVVRCWGNNSYGQCDAPSGPFVEVAAGAYHSLGLRPDGSVACWGISSPAGLQCVNVPDEAFFELACGENHSVAKTANGELMCWGWDSHDQLVPPGGSFSSITSGWWHSIGLRSNGELVQWGGQGPAGASRIHRLAVISRWRRVITTLLASWIPPSPVRKISTMTSLSILPI